MIETWRGRSRGEDNTCPVYSQVGLQRGVCKRVSATFQNFLEKVSDEPNVPSIFFWLENAWKKDFYLCVCEHVCVCTHSTAHEWRSEDNFTHRPLPSSLFFYRSLFCCCRCQANWPEWGSVVSASRLTTGGPVRCGRYCVQPYVALGACMQVLALVWQMLNNLKKLGHNFQGNISVWVGKIILLSCY